MTSYRYWIGILGATFLGMIFIIAGVGKLLAQPSTYEPFAFWIIHIPAVTDTISAGLPYAEIIIGLLLICGIVTRLATGVSAALIACFAASNLYLLSIGVGICGGCFGVAGGLSVYAALTIDGIMAALVLVIFICHRGDDFNISPWFLTGHTVTRGAKSSACQGA